ncbi:MAG TPA: alpha/beta fold hydrolase [Burkholderiales bacterium]|nr:alpha/beta fold hydrolase [Burkholderiales bacterium]
MKIPLANVLMATTLVLSGGVPQAAETEDGIRARLPALVTEDIHVASDTPGITLFVRNKHPRDFTPSAAKTVLYVHGATYPASTAFDLALDGMSWMDYIAAQGWDVYLVDLRGYGLSTRPAEMDSAARDNAPIVTTDVAVRDVGAAVDYILKRRGLPKIDLIGWSWGTSIMAAYAAANNDKVGRLVLYAPLWLRNTPGLIGGDGPLGAWRAVTREAAKKRWLTGVPEDRQADLIPAGWFEAWAEATWATDPKAKDDGALRAPNGVIQDVREYWASGKPYYDPANIRVPTLLIKAEWDRDTPAYMAQTLFPLLKNAPAKRYVEIGGGTHTVIMEKNRMQLFREVQAFLDEPD